MLNDIAAKKDNVKYVLVFKLSRFGRNAADVLNSLQFMQDYGVKLICFYWGRPLNGGFPEVGVK